MNEPIEPPEERQQLAAELRKLRDQAGVSGRELATGIGGISQSKVSRIESGKAMPTLPQVERWADLTGASPEQKRALIKLAERAFTEIHSWSRPLRDSPHAQHEISEQEADAWMVRTFQPSSVPGLLQTAQYARHVFGLSPLPSVREDIAAAVADRMRRQLAVYELDQGFEFLITEEALRWCPGPDAAALLPAQLDRVASLSTLENISIGVLPAGGQALAYASHGFVIYEGHEADATFVTVEAIHAGMRLFDPGEIDIYKQTWFALERMAVFGDEARGLLAELASELR
ncbi:helix-turn-helix domain-containing protein [Actinomadura rubrisoli]|uniref:XRE family transcriptional regulator n=1 Tax=Actinomadura rubrisoli TaxID=2530368 RepID=A0A4R5CDA9_9ACTN|nr:helix-turn-helix transcriptional regulator [Actinomadura rubrisoli]TDD95132.1 XRE family transcriptional regulator [Actinomadura rubrisoli]